MLFQLQANEIPTIRDMMNHAVLSSLLFILCILIWQDQANGYKSNSGVFDVLSCGEAWAVPLVQVIM